MALKTEQKIYAATGVLVVLLGALFFVQKNAKEDAMAHSTSATASALPQVKVSAEDADKITKLELVNATKSDVVLEKEGDTWKVTKPVDYLANPNNVKTVTDNLKEVVAKDVLDTGNTQYATYDLDDDKAIHVQAWKGADKIVDLYFGKNGSRGQMMRVAGKDGVYITTGWSNYLYTREVKEWRDRELLKFEDANVIGATVNNDNGAFSFSKSGDTWSGTLKGKPIANFDQEKVKDMLRAYRLLSADDFGDDKTPADTGLDKPAVVAFTMKDNGGTIKMNVGKATPTSTRYAQKEGNPTIYTISSWAGDWATAAESKFQKPESKDGGATTAAKLDTSKKK
ncbi:MAG TPA: DUF4340 domain-containing protein [Polyangiaceae bacterium]|jgi:hypothetical protein